MASDDAELRRYALSSARSTVLERERAVDDGLQTLSDLCTGIRLCETQSQAVILSESVQRHVVTPIRRRRQTGHGSQTNYEDGYLTQLATQLVRQCCVNTVDENNNRNGVIPMCKVLDALLHMIETETGMVIVIKALQGIWSDTLNILTTHLRRWLEHGLIDDMNQEFFISSHTDMSGAIIVKIEPCALPCFVTRQMGDTLMFIGTAAKCVRVLTLQDGTSPRSQANKGERMLDLDIEMTFERMRADPLSAGRVLDGACLTWRREAAGHLSIMIGFDAIATRVRHLRDYVLQGNSLFWRCVFEDMRRLSPIAKMNEQKACGVLHMDDEEQQGIQRMLNQLLASTAVEFVDATMTRLDSYHPDKLDRITSVYEHGHTNDDGNIGNKNVRRINFNDNDNNDDDDDEMDFPVWLDVSHDGRIRPKFTLSLSEGHILGSRASVYCDTFRLTFGLRHTACELADAFTNLIQLQRAIRSRGKGQSMRFIRRHLVGMTELRRRMMTVVECIEWYVQASVIQPKMDHVLNMLGKRPSDGKEVFDAAHETHAKCMDEVTKEGFIADNAIVARLDAICAVCMRLCHLIRNLFVHDQSAIADGVVELVAHMKEEFNRNVQLFKQMLHVYKTSVDSQVVRLLIHLDFGS